MLVLVYYFWCQINGVPCQCLNRGSDKFVWVMLKWEWEKSHLGLKWVRRKKSLGKIISMLLNILSVKCRWMNKWYKDLNRDLGFLIFVFMCFEEGSWSRAIQRGAIYFSKKQVEKSSRDSWPLCSCIRAAEKSVCRLLAPSKAFICFLERSFLFGWFLMVAAVEHNGCCSLHSFCAAVPSRKL